MTDLIDCVDYSSPAASNIMVIGVGGGGGNAVKYMYDIGIHNVYFMVCNTDAQALKCSPVPLKIQLGTVGLGAGNQPDKGRDAALESSEEIRAQLEGSKVRMVFITAGMGGGTGTGAAPVIAQIAHELGILTVGIVTIPFRLEGRKRLAQAETGLEEMRRYVDSLLVIDNENICKMYGDLDFSEAFGKADDILAIAAKGIAEAITKEHKVNVDFADVHTTMSNSGISLLGYASADLGTENVAIELTEEALMSPLLNQNNIHGAQDILINISWNQSELKMAQLHAIIGHVQAAAGNCANIIWGAGKDTTLGENEASLIIIATNFSNSAKIDLGASVVTNSSSKVDSKIVEVEQVEAELVIEREVLNLDDDALIEEESVVEEVPDMVISTPEETKPTVAVVQEVKTEPEEIQYIPLYDTAPVEEKIEEPKEMNDFSVSYSDKKDESVVPQAEKAVQAVETPSELYEKSEAQREYTIDELESMPAYARRNYVEKLKNSPTSEIVKEKLDF